MFSKMSNRQTVKAHSADFKFGGLLHLLNLSINFHPDLLDSVMICKSEMAKLSRMECSFILALVKIVSLPGTVS